MTQSYLGRTDLNIMPRGSFLFLVILPSLNDIHDKAFDIFFLIIIHFLNNDVEIK